MQRVIVTVKRQNEARVRDLEVPAEVEAELLSRMIAQTLRWDSDPAGQPVEYDILAVPPGRVLTPHESLAEAGVWDGAWLVFQQVGAVSPLSPPENAQGMESPVAGDGPVIGWRPLGIELPAGFEEQSPDTELPDDRKPEQDEGPVSDGFAWKKLD